MSHPRRRQEASPLRHALAKRSDNGASGYNNVSRVNLFYILIAILAAFALISLFNFSRMRRRRRRIINEAMRLGLIVPGMDGYIPMRDRPGFVKSHGWKTPYFWEILRGPTNPSNAGASRSGNGGGGAITGMDPGSRGGVELVGERVDGLEEVDVDRLREAKGETEHFEVPPGDTPSRGPTPLRAEGVDETFGAKDLLELPPWDEVVPISLIPAPEEAVLPPKPISNIPYFPNFVSYRKEQFEVRPSRFADPDALGELVGESVDVVFAVRMPAEPVEAPLPPEGEDDDFEIVREWAGLELGVTSVYVSR